MSSELIKKECEGGYYYFHPQATIERGALIGPDTKIWADAHIFMDAIIGSNCVIARGVHIEPGVQLGNYNKVQRGAVIYKGVRSEDYVFFGPNATTTNDRNPRSFGDWELAETEIRIGAAIGANATLIAGNEIGPFALVGAGAVVTKPVPGCQAVAGNPAKFIGWVNESGHTVSRGQEAPDHIKAILDNPTLAIKKYLETQNV